MLFLARTARAGEIRFSGPDGAKLKKALPVLTEHKQDLFFRPYRHEVRASGPGGGQKSNVACQPERLGVKSRRYISALTISPGSGVVYLYKPCGAGADIACDSNGAK